MPFQGVTSGGESKKSERITDAHFITEGRNYPFVRSDIHNPHLVRHFKERTDLPMHEDEIDIMGVFHKESRDRQQECCGSALLRRMDLPVYHDHSRSSLEDNDCETRELQSAMKDD